MKTNLHCRIIAAILQQKKAFYHIDKQYCVTEKFSIKQNILKNFGSHKIIKIIVIIVIWQSEISQIPEIPECEEIHTYIYMCVYVFELLLMEIWNPSCKYLG